MQGCIIYFVKTGNIKGGLERVEAVEQQLGKNTNLTKHITIHLNSLKLTACNKKGNVKQICL